MALKPNASLIFDHYEVVATGGIVMTFLCHDPGPGENYYWSIFVTDAELATVTDLSTFQTLVLDKRNRLVRASGIASKLDTLIGRTVTLP